MAEQHHIHIYSETWVTEEGTLEPVIKLNGPRNAVVITFADNLVKQCRFKVLLEFQDPQSNEDMDEGNRGKTTGGNVVGDEIELGGNGAGSGNINESGNQGGNGNENWDRGEEGNKNGNGSRGGGGSGSGSRSGNWSGGRNASGSNGGWGESRGGGESGSRFRNGTGNGEWGGSGTENGEWDGSGSEGRGQSGNESENWRGSRSDRGEGRNGRGNRDRGTRIGRNRSGSGVGIESENGNWDGSGGGSGDKSENGGGESGSSDMPYTQTGINWCFHSDLADLQAIWAFYTRLRVMLKFILLQFQKQATGAQFGHFTQDYKGMCTVKMKEDGKYWKLQTGIVYAWVNENANSLDVQSSHAHIKAARQIQNGYNLGLTVAAGQAPSAAITGGISHNKTTQTFRPFYTISAAARNEHRSRGQALQVKRSDTSGILTGDPELALELTVDSAKDQVVSLNIETYWRLAPVKKKSNKDHKVSFKSLEALLICHQLAIPDISNLNDLPKEDLVFEGPTDGTSFQPQMVVLDSGANQNAQGAGPAGYRVFAGAQTQPHSLRSWSAIFGLKKKKKILAMDMVLFRHENGKTTMEEARHSWQNMPDPKLLLSQK
ncbi:hypothetical protein GYMLUDRAFT_1004596 [Collybiopsis luxurians FD-317 M1]|uniref:Uncharacterized protein n=1 Tax=Collybiopsis luxurians FD-317 M1 TaxID=944289 RepID=A0A0D0BUP6_9AGAR|nr:hypothetical protein GYMLUDRAFT_1004596 [Collybiopsis luxurians FD-317 M1]